MNLKKLVTAAVCTMLMAAVAFTAGCGGEKKSDKKVLKVGMECAYAPYNWSQTKADGGAVKIAGSNEYAYGYDVMMAKKLADSMGADLEIHKSNGMVWLQQLSAVRLTPLLQACLLPLNVKKL